MFIVAFKGGSNLEDVGAVILSEYAPNDIPLTIREGNSHLHLNYPSSRTIVLNTGRLADQIS